MTHYTLDNLSSMRFGGLESLYRSGSVPTDLAILDNKPKGRTLSMDWFPFTTRVHSSLIDGEDTIVVEAKQQRRGERFVVRPRCVG